MLEKIVLYLLGVLSTGAGVLFMRYMKKEHVTEDLARRKSAADLIAHLQQIGVPMERVDALLSSIGRRRGDKVHQIEHKPLSIEEQHEAQEFAAIEAAKTQSEMNSRQGERARRLNRRMEDALEKLHEVLVDPELTQKLNEAQARWLEFRDKECAFTGAQFEGGTMQSFITAGTYSYVTKQRAEMLENELAAFSNL